MLASGRRDAPGAVGRAPGRCASINSLMDCVVRGVVRGDHEHPFRGNFKQGQEGRASVREEGEGQRGRNGGGAEHLL